MKTIKRTIDPYNLFNPGKVCRRSVRHVSTLIVPKLYPDPTHKEGVRHEPQPSIPRSGSSGAKNG